MKQILRQGVLCVPLLFVITSCAAIVFGTREEFETSGHKSLKPRASFDLSCPADQLVVHPLGDPASFPYGTVGVEGCGRKAMYTRIDGKWVRGAEDAALY